MKRKCKILFELLFIPAILCCTVINAHTDCVNQLFIIEHSAGENSVESNTGQDYSSLHQDQIDNSASFDLTVELKSKIPTLLNYTLINNFSISVWQPPKIL
jgi:hypothetical protein